MSQCICENDTFSLCNYLVLNLADISVYLCLYSGCSNGAVRLYNSQSNYTDGELTVTGIAEVCDEGEWIPFCDDGSGQYDSSDFIAVAACSNLGYSG